MAFLLAALLVAPVTFGDPGAFDEGFMATGAMMIRRGWVAMQDFYTTYGPGEYYLLALVFSVFTEDLAASRVVHVLTLGLLGACLCRTSIRVANGRAAWGVFALVGLVVAVAYAKPSSTYPAVTAALLLLATVGPFERWFVSGSYRSLVAASLWIGAAGLFRWDFGLFGAAAFAAAVLIVQGGRRERPGRILRPLVIGVVPGVALAVFITAFFVHGATWSRWLAEVPIFLARDFGTYRGVSFVGRRWSEVVDGARHGSVAFIAIGRLLSAATPFVLVAATLLVVGRRALRARLNAQDAACLLLALIVFTLFNQLRVRPVQNQAFPSTALCLPLVAYLGGSVVQATWKRACIVLASSLLLIGLPGAAAYPFTRLAFDGSLNRIHEPKLALAQVDADAASGWAEHRSMIRFIQEHVPKDEPIFSGVTDTSLLLINDALLYFLADRRSATRWIEMDPGIANTVAAQLEIIDELQRNDVRLVALVDIQSHEANASSVSNGVHLLDDYVRKTYSEVHTFGLYEIRLKPPAEAKPIR